MSRGTRIISDPQQELRLNLIIQALDQANSDYDKVKRELQNAQKEIVKLTGEQTTLNATINKLTTDNQALTVDNLRLDQVVKVLHDENSNLINKLVSYQSALRLYYDKFGDINTIITAIQDSTTSNNTTTTVGNDNINILGSINAPLSVIYEDTST
jgi:chromosome segregation ATPase